MPALGEAGHHGACPPGRRLGVLRVDRGPVHGVRRRGGSLTRTVGRARPGRCLSIVATGAHGNEAGDGRDDAKGAGRERRTGEKDGDGDGAGTIWCDMPSFARFSYWGDEQATGRAGYGL